MIVKVSLPTICIVKRQICSTSFLGSIVVSIPACHAGDRVSIPRRGEISRSNGAIFWFKQIWINFLIFVKKCQTLISVLPIKLWNRTSDNHWPSLIYLSDDSRGFTSNNLFSKKTNLQHLIPRQYSGEYPRLSPGRCGSIPRREEEVIAIVLLFG